MTDNTELAMAELIAELARQVSALDQRITALMEHFDEKAVAAVKEAARREACTFF